MVSADIQRGGGSGRREVIVASRQRVHGPASRIQHRESRLRRGAADARDARAGGQGGARDLVAARGRRGEAELVDVAAAQDGAQALVLGMPSSAVATGRLA